MAIWGSSGDFVETPPDAFIVQGFNPQQPLIARFLNWILNRVDTFLGTTFLVEHDADGTHDAITATSLTLSGAITTTMVIGPEQMQQDYAYYHPATELEGAYAACGGAPGDNRYIQIPLDFRDSQVTRPTIIDDGITIYLTHPGGGNNAIIHLQQRERGVSTAWTSANSLTLTNPSGTLTGHVLTTGGAVQIVTGYDYRLVVETVSGDDIRCWGAKVVYTGVSLQPQ